MIPLNVNFVELPERVKNAGEVGVAYSGSGAERNGFDANLQTGLTNACSLQPTCPWILCCRFLEVLVCWSQIFCPPESEWSPVQTQDYLWAACWCPAGKKLSKLNGSKGNFRADKSHLVSFPYVLMRRQEGREAFSETYWHTHGLNQFN